MNLALVIATSLLLAVHFFVTPIPLAAFWSIPGLFVLSLFLQGMMTRARKVSFHRFTTAFMGATTIKLLSTMVFMLVYAYQFPETRQAFLLSVFGVYVIFTVALIRDFSTEKNA